MMPKLSPKSHLVSSENSLPFWYFKLTEVGAVKVTEVAPGYAGLLVRLAIGHGGAPSMYPMS